MENIKEPNQTNLINIDKIRRKAIANIKEKAKNNPKYLSPMNKERQEDMKKLKFANGYEFTCWLQQNGVMASPTNVNRRIWKKTIENATCKTITEYNNICAQKAGFKNYAECEKIRRWNKGEDEPAEFNEDCPSYFGELTEEIMIQTFEDPIKMPYGNPGFDWTCKRGDKIDNKGICLNYIVHVNWSGWKFNIRHNDIADWFILSAWDSRDSLNPLHVWAFHKNDIVRGRKFCEFEKFSITNTPKKLKELERFEVTNRLEKLKELCSIYKKKE